MIEQVKELIEEQQRWARQQKKLDAEVDLLQEKLREIGPSFYFIDGKLYELRYIGRGFRLGGPLTFVLHDKVFQESDEE